MQSQTQVKIKAALGFIVIGQKSCIYVELLIKALKEDTLWFVDCKRKLTSAIARILLLATACSMNSIECDEQIVILHTKIILTKNCSKIKQRTIKTRIF